MTLVAGINLVNSNYLGYGSKIKSNTAHYYLPKWHFTDDFYCPLTDVKNKTKPVFVFSIYTAYASYLWFDFLCAICDPQTVCNI